MNEQAQKVLTDLLQRAVTGVDKAVEFSQAQIPDVIHQLLVWNAVSSILIQVFLLILCICIVLVIRWTWKEDDENLMFATMILGVILLLTFTVFIFYNFDWLKIWLAPKLYLLEYTASLVK